MEPARPDPQADAERETAPLRVGEILGSKYELTRKIGEGGMGEVYEARHVVLGRRFAVKLLHPELTRSHRMLHRFSREALEASRLESDHVVSVFDCGHTSVGTPYYVMELLHGEDLRHLLKRDGTLAVSRAVRIAVDLCRGLEAAHDRSLVHRDLKPENVFITQSDVGREVAKILDFGVVLVRGSAPTTQAGTLIGTLRYMSPEQVRGDSRVDARADIYALGVILYECLVGEAPYQGRSSEELLFQVMNHAPRPVRELRPEIPAGLEAVITRALDRDPQSRHSSALELSEALVPYGGADLGPLRTRYEIRAPAASDTDTRADSGVTVEEAGPARGIRDSKRSKRNAVRTASGLALAALVGSGFGFFVGARGTQSAREPRPAPSFSDHPLVSAVVPLPPSARTQEVVAAPASSEAMSAKEVSAADSSGSRPKAAAKAASRVAHPPAWFDSQNPYERTPRAP
jgi:serine/threonine-protein kinase